MWLNWPMRNNMYRNQCPNYGTWQITKSIIFEPILWHQLLQIPFEADYLGSAGEISFRTVWKWLPFSATCRSNENLDGSPMKLLHFSRTNPWILGLLPKGRSLRFSAWNLSGSNFCPHLTKNISEVGRWWAVWPVACERQSSSVALGESVPHRLQQIGHWFLGDSLRPTSERNAWKFFRIQVWRHEDFTWVFQLRCLFAVLDCMVIDVRHVPYTASLLFQSACAWIAIRSQFSDLSPFFCNSDKQYAPWQQVRDRWQQI